MFFLQQKDVLSIDLASNVIFLAVGRVQLEMGFRGVESGFKSFWNQVSSEIPVGELFFYVFFRVRFVGVGRLLPQLVQLGVKTLALCRVPGTAGNLRPLMIEFLSC